MSAMALKPTLVNFEEKWNSLQDTVEKVVTMENIKRNKWNESFSDIYFICIALPDPGADIDAPKRLYLETKKLLESHVQSLYSNVSALSEEKLLTQYHQCWLQFSEGIDYLNSLYKYLNTHYVQNYKNPEADYTYGSLQVDPSDQLLEIGELGLEIWQNQMIDPLKKRLVAVLLKCIQQDRFGLSADAPTSVVRGVIFSFVEVNVYKKKNNLELYETVFQGELLKEVGSYYRSQASSLLQSCTLSQYMEWVTAHIAEEELRATKLLPPSSHQHIIEEIQGRMVGDHLQTILSECNTMVVKEKTQDLTNMYTLLRPMKEGFSVLVGHFQEHIKQQGLRSVTQLKGDNVPQLFVENLLGVHGKYRSMIALVFHNDQQFDRALDKAFEAIVNYRPTPKNVCKSPEVLARYCDILLKKSTKGLSENEIDDRLGNVITIFRYIDDKDVFQKFYARMLAKRLIHQLSHSLYTEEAMIDRLKQACGYEFTSKLHRMYTDMSISAGHTKKFNEYLKDQKIDLGISFTINVLQAGAWPLGQTAVPTFAIPHELERFVQSFEKFYHKSFNGRKLTWLHHFCQGELKVSHTKKTYIITMPTFQMAMLLQYEKTNSLTYEELQQFTQLSDENFSKFLQSLIDSKLLLCDQEELKSDANVNLNMEFTNKRTKFKISVVNIKEQHQENEQTHAAVDEDRKLYIQAAIVRIMKARKLLKHNHLIQEVISQSSARFVPAIPMIKKCIELLIDKQYLERANNSADEYSYVA